MCLCYVHYLEHDAENHIGRRHVLLCSLKSENRENIIVYTIFVKRMTWMLEDDLSSST